MNERTQTMLEAKDVVFRYSETGHNAIDGLSMQVKKGEYVAVLGANGCGKSTLAKHFNAILLPAAGTVWIEQIPTTDEDRLMAVSYTHLQGIYVEAVETSRLWDELDAIRSVCSAKIMWEIPTSAALDPERHSNVLKTIEKTDLFSINFPEAKALFGVETRQQTVDRLLALGKPCFFRVGSQGAYMLADGEAAFAPSVTVGPVVDPTGCGNVSTAAALYGWCEGYTLQKTARLANISAAYNLLQYGPCPAVSEEMRHKAKELLQAD